MRKRYPTDLSEAEWNYIEPHLPAPKGYGRPRTYDLREILNAVFFHPAEGEVAVMRMLAATHTFHRALPPSRIWTYAGVLPGPIIEVQHDREVRIEWHSALEGTLPVIATIAPRAPEGEMPVQCLPGLRGGSPGSSCTRPIRAPWSPSGRTPSSTERSDFLKIGRDELWRLINLTGDTHPIHVHLVQLQALARYGVTCDVSASGITETDTTSEVSFGAPDDDTVPHKLDEGEQGLKDTIRVNPNEVLDIALRFEPYAGRFMYHCHILEHEDRDMMHPIVVTPREGMDFLSVPGMSGTDPRNGRRSPVRQGMLFARPHQRCGRESTC